MHFLKSYFAESRRLAAVVAAGSLLCALSLTLRPAQAAQKELKRFEFSLPRMGTVFRIVLYAADANQGSSAAMAAFERVEQLEQMMSDYREDSELTFICKNAWQSPQRASQELYHVLEKALQFSEMSGGAFDVSIGPVVVLWRSARRSKHIPSQAEITRAKEAVGYKNIVLNAPVQTVYLKRKDMKLDLGAIAKGYAADEALALLRSRGINRALVAGGGDIRAGDPPPDKQGWKIAIRQTEPKEVEPSHYVFLHNIGIATSGEAFQFVEIDGKKYSHIVDPKTGLGMQDSVTATVIAPDAITADAVATAACILPVPDALRLAVSLKSVSMEIWRRSGVEFKHFSSQSFPKVIDAGPK